MTENGYGRKLIVLEQLYEIGAVISEIRRVLFGSELLNQINH
jgi:hypothetical protein